MFRRQDTFRRQDNTKQISTPGINIRRNYKWDIRIIGGERAAHLVLESFPNTQNREQININKGNISSIVPVGGEEGGGETQVWAPP